MIKVNPNMHNLPPKYYSIDQQPLNAHDIATPCSERDIKIQVGLEFTNRISANVNVAQALSNWLSANNTQDRAAIEEFTKGALSTEELTKLLAISWEPLDRINESCKQMRENELPVSQPHDMIGQIPLENENLQKISLSGLDSENNLGENNFEGEGH